MVSIISLVRARTCASIEEFCNSALVRRRSRGDRPPIRKVAWGCPVRDELSLNRYQAARPRSRALAAARRGEWLGFPRAVLIASSLRSRISRRRDMPPVRDERTKAMRAGMCSPALFFWCCKERVIGALSNASSDKVTALPRSWAQMVRRCVLDGMPHAFRLRCATCSQENPARSGAISNVGKRYRLLLRVLTSASTTISARCSFISPGTNHIAACRIFISAQRQHCSRSPCNSRSSPSSLARSGPYGI
jgi:hypothetical protein